VVIALAIPLAWAASAQSVVDATVAAGVSRLVVRLRADVRPASGATLPDSSLADLQGYLGRRLAGATATASGNQVIELATPVDIATARQLVNALRMRSDVVWAEFQRGIHSPPAAAKSAVAGAAGPASVRRLIVTFADPEMGLASRRNANPGAAQDAALSAAAGTPLRLLRATIGGAWLVELSTAVDMATAEAIAAKLESAGLVRFASPDYPVRTSRVPNDPFYGSGDQWSLQDRATTGHFGVDATHAWDITTGSANTVVAVVDTGIQSHPDLAGRILPGYDFVSSVTSANDGNGRDADATDPGDWRTAGLCPSPMNDKEDSDWHGTLVTGVIAANSNNGVGIAGIDWNAQIVPVRVLGRCGGDFSDILDGMAWAAGLPVPGVPPNSHPAKVINLSSGGKGQCTSQIQALVDEILDAGVFIAVSAGNDNASSDNYIPASCLGVSTVAATDFFGARASYSNFSTGMDIAAPGGDPDRNGDVDTITTTWNSGTTVAMDPDYASAAGTSLAAPHVAGIAALMLAVNPALLPAQIKSMMAQSASSFAVGSDCATAGICGAGIVNALGAVQAAQASLGGLPVTQVVEFYNQSLNHYFMTALLNEVQALDNNQYPGWARTGYTFNAYPVAEAGFGPVCRFYIPPAYGDSHFYSASPSECAIALSDYPWFIYEAPNVFYIGLPDTTTGACPAGTIPIYRVWDRLPDTNHRYMTSTAVRDSMVAQGWVAEGYGPNQVIMCAPQ
jgi:serine protease